MTPLDIGGRGKNMKTLLTFFTLNLIIFQVNSTPVTNINAVYRNGQVFVTWDNSNGNFYFLYKSSSPILHGNQLSSAQNLGKVNSVSAFNVHANRYLRIDSASPPLASTKGLFTATSTANGLFYYAVTTIISNVEDTSINFVQNSLSTPVNEAIDNPIPVWQDTSRVGATLFHIYVWFATRVTSPNYPQMTGAGSYPLNFAIVQQGTQSPHPVTFCMRPSGGSFFDPTYVWGTGNPNDWIISIDDYNPNPVGAGIATFYYGYHENYDIYNPNPIPTGGTIYNYTSTMVSHTVNWALRNLPLDSTRTYMTGWSLGAIGSVFNSLTMPSKIAAIFLYAPLFNAAAGTPCQLGLTNALNLLYGTYETNLLTNEGMRRNDRLNVDYLLSINRLNSLPIIYSFCGKNDVNVCWPEKIAFYDSMNVLKHGGFHFWSMSTHQQVFNSNPWRIASFPPSFPFFTRYRTNLSYPAFSNCSANNNPGNGSPSSGDSIGQINGFLDWNDDIIDSIYRWEITLKTKDLVTIYDTLHTPDSCTADVTLRRLQRFNITDSSTIQWTNTRNNEIVQQGSFPYSGGLITIPNVKIYKFSNTLRVVQIPIGIVKNSNSIPSRFQLYQNYPNPFNPITRISFDIPKRGLVVLKIFDILGREVSVLVNEFKQPGRYNINFNSENIASGVYFFRLTAGEFTETRKMMLIK